MQLKLVLLALIPSIFAIPNAAPVSEPFEPGSLQARSCSETTGCTSEAGASAGKYCGFCTQVRGTYNVDDIYQVNGGSGSSSCCNYGKSNACAAEWPKVSPNFLYPCKNSGKGF